jgi:heptosyltransferase II
MAPPTSGARELLAAEPSIAEVVYFEHSGSEVRRFLNMLRFAALLRQQHFRTVWILDCTVRAAIAALLAGIPERIGVGLTAQRHLITNPGIAQSHYHDFPIDWLIALMAEMKVPLPSTEPDLQIPQAVIAAIGEKFAAYPRPWIVFGIASSHPDKEWPDEYWGELLSGLRGLTSGTLLLIGGAVQSARAEKLIASAAAPGAAIVNACDLKLIESAALLHEADLFIGNDSGPLNLAAAVGTDAFGIFGNTPVLKYSKFIRPIVPAGGPAPGGLQRVLPAQVIEQARPFLARRKRGG